MSNLEIVRQRRRVTPNYPELNQAVVPFEPLNPLPPPRNDNLALTVNNHLSKPSPKKTTKVLAVVTRARDKIYLTEDDKGKQMVVQRSHNVAKVQRRQRDENYNPSDLRLRGKQRPAAVGVVGHIDNVAEEDALWRARQHMQNVQTLHSEQHRPIQEEEERRLAEETRLKSLAKNEKKMKSYKVDMGHVLTTEEGASSMTVEGAVQDGAGGLCNGDKRETNNDSFESYGEYIDDEVYDNNTGEDLKLEEPSGNATANVLVGDHQDSAIAEDNKNNVLVEHNHDSAIAEDSKSNVLVREANSPGESNQDIVSDGHNESARDEKVNRFVGDNQSEDNDFAYEQYNSYDSDSDSESIENNPTDDVNNDFMGDEQCLVVYEEQARDSNQAPPQQPSSSSGQNRPMSEKEQRRIAMNRQREMNIRQRQQLNMEQVIIDTAESRRQEAERKAEEARQKALALNEKKMKSYKVTMGYSLEDYLNQDNIEQESSASPNENRGREQQRQMNSTMLTRESQRGGYNERNTEEKKVQQRVLNSETASGTARQGCCSETQYITKDKAATTIPCTGSGSTIPCTDSAAIPCTGSAATIPCTGGDSKGLINGRAVSKDTPCDVKGEVTVSNQTADCRGELVSGETEQTETLTEEQRQRLFREQMLAARLKKQREMDLLVEQEKRKDK
uniref:Uncharacterized protein n=1 Tax=Cacopsylla melanoneura TaxID=428564 RepID=A0A8D8RXI5_9HEMI